MEKLDLIGSSCGFLSNDKEGNISKGTENSL